MIGGLHVVTIWSAGFDGWAEPRAFPPIDDATLERASVFSFFLYGILICLGERRGCICMWVFFFPGWDLSFVDLATPVAVGVSKVEPLFKTQAI